MADQFHEGQTATGNNGEKAIYRGGGWHVIASNPAEFGMIKAMADGRMALPTGPALRSPQMQKIIGALSVYDPTFDAANQHTRVKTRADFTSGKSAQNLTALNTSIAHLGHLHELSNNISETPFPIVNKMVEKFKRETGDPEPGKFDETRDAVANELTKVFRGTGGAEADIKGWQKTFRYSDSAAQREAAIKTAVDLMHGRMDAVAHQYEQGMGKSVNPLHLLSPEAANTLQRIQGGHPTPPRAAAPAAQSGLPGAGSVDPAHLSNADLMKALQGGN
jgi:hypothetical protein